MRVSLSLNRFEGEEKPPHLRLQLVVDELVREVLALLDERPEGLWMTVTREVEPK